MNKTSERTTPHSRQPSTDNHDPMPDDSDLPMYRVEESDGTYAGHADSQSGAAAMADETERFASSDGPHRVREVPQKDVELNGPSTGRIVYTTCDHKPTNIEVVSNVGDSSEFEIEADCATCDERLYGALDAVSDMEVLD